MPTITLTNPNKTLYLNVSAPEMVEGKTGTDYYAVADTCSENASCNSTTEKNHNIAKLEITNSDVGTKYKCTGKLKVSASGTLYDESSLTTGDVTIIIDNLTDEGGSETIDLLTIKNNEPAGSKEYDISYSLTGDSSKEILADVMLSNQEADQNALAGKTLSVTMEATGVECTIDAATD